MKKPPLIAIAASALGEGKMDAEVWPWREDIGGVSHKSQLFTIPMHDLGE